MFKFNRQILKSRNSPLRDCIPRDDFLGTDEAGQLKSKVFNVSRETLKGVTKLLNIEIKNGTYYVNGEPATKSEVQIITAEKAYIMPLKKTKSLYGYTVTFAIYTQAGRRPLEILWAKEVNHEGGKHKLFNHQRFSQKSDPAFAFRLGGCGYSKENELAIFLHEYNKKLEVYSIAGYSPYLIQTYNQ